MYILGLLLFLKKKKKRCCFFSMTKLHSFATFVNIYIYIYETFVPSLHPCLHCLLFVLLFFSDFTQSSQINIFMRLEIWPQQVPLKISVFSSLLPVPTRSLLRSCTHTARSEKQVPWSATKYPSPTRQLSVEDPHTTLLPSCPLGTCRSQPLSPWVTTGPTRASGTPLWLLGKATTSISRP